MGTGRRYGGQRRAEIIDDCPDRRIRRKNTVLSGERTIPLIDAGRFAALLVKGRMLHGLASRTKTGRPSMPRLFRAEASACNPCL